MKPSIHSKINQCTSCGGTNLITFLETKDYFLTQEQFELLKCENCGLILTNPVPSQAEIGKYYNSPEYLSHNSSVQNLTSSLYNFLRKINIRRKFQFVNSFQAGKNILDYGCGSGQLLQYFKKKNWNITGVEPNEEARKYASQLTKTKILSNQEFESLSQESFDVVTLWHVLEHVHNLNEVIRKLRFVLKTTGVLIIAVPNINSPDAHKYKEKWAALDVPRHLYHFSAESMRKLLLNHDIQVQEVKPIKLDTYYISLLSEKYKGNKFPFIKAFFEAYTSNRQARQKNNYSSLIFVAKKK